MLTTQTYAQQSHKTSWSQGELVLELSANQWHKASSSIDKQLLAEALNVSLTDSADINILGKVSVDTGKRKFIFKPRFPIDPGTELTIKVSHILKARFVVPGKSNQRNSTVTKIYPTANKLPANLLKFYIHFSQPMQRGNIYQHFSIVDLKKNIKVELPFLELEEELWSRDGKRLTLFFDPGRIKRGLKPRQDLGPIFAADRSYQFRISGKWKGANGIQLGQDIVKEFKTIEEDHTPPTLKNWTVRTTSVGPKNAVVIRFDEPLDSALCFRVISLEVDQKPLSIFQKKLDAGERKLTLISKDPIPKGKLRARIGSELEDLCGNRIGKPFDFDPKTDQPANDSKSFLIELKNLE